VERSDFFGTVSSRIAGDRQFVRICPVYDDRHAHGDLGKSLVRGGQRPRLSAFASHIGRGCIAAANAGTLLGRISDGASDGATPRKQQYTELGSGGVLLGPWWDVQLMTGAGESGKRQGPGIRGVSQRGPGVRTHFHQVKIRVMNAGKLSDTRPAVVMFGCMPEFCGWDDGKYLSNPQCNRSRCRAIGAWKGEGAAPQARLMATVVNGSGPQLRGAWILGVFLGIGWRYPGSFASFAVARIWRLPPRWRFLPVVSCEWMIDRAVENEGKRKARLSTGSLIASGLIAGRGIVGIDWGGVKRFDTATGNRCAVSKLILSAHDWVSV